MATSTSLIGLSLASSTESQTAEEERLSLLKRNNHIQNLAHLKALRKKEIAAIQAIFANIRIKLAFNDKNDSLINGILDDLLRASNELERTLIDEVHDPSNDINRARITALRYQSALNDVLTDKKSLADKTHSITEFKNHARSSKLSQSTRQIIGAAVGALFFSSSFLTLAAVTGTFALVSGPIGIAAFCMGLLICVGLGALNGALAARRLAKNPEEKRGQEVSKHLTRLAVEKDRLFQSPQKRTIAFKVPFDATTNPRRSY